MTLAVNTSSESKRDTRVVERCRRETSADVRQSLTGPWRLSSELLSQAPSHWTKPA